MRMKNVHGYASARKLYSYACAEFMHKHPPYDSIFDLQDADSRPLKLVAIFVEDDVPTFFQQFSKVRLLLFVRELHTCGQAHCATDKWRIYEDLQLSFVNQNRHLSVNVSHVG
eukprot:352421-Chlamydomonas_euryale.AAC.93